MKKKVIYIRVWTNLYGENKKGIDIPAGYEPFFIQPMETNYVRIWCKKCLKIMEKKSHDQ